MRRGPKLEHIADERRWGASPVVARLRTVAHACATTYIVSLMYVFLKLAANVRRFVKESILTVVLVFCIAPHTDTNIWCDPCCGQGRTRVGTRGALGTLGAISVRRSN